MVVINSIPMICKAIESRARQVGSLRAYARHRAGANLDGQSLAAVQKAISSQRISAAITPEGKIDFKQADALWTANTQFKPGVKPRLSGDFKPSVTWVVIVAVVRLSETSKGRLFDRPDYVELARKYCISGDVAEWEAAARELLNKIGRKC